MTEKETTEVEKNLGADAAAVDTARSAEAASPASHVGHTPGPWTVDHPHVRAAHTAAKNEGRHHSVASVSTNRRVFATGEATANAHLIAAAPDLYNALKLAECVYRKNVVAVGEPSSVLDAMQAAIAKAEGR